MKHPIDIHWARAHLRGFKDLEIVKLANDREKKRLERKYQDCPRPKKTAGIPDAFVERRAA
jgi:hypothetical protein